MQELYGQIVRTLWIDFAEELRTNLPFYFAIQEKLGRVCGQTFILLLLIFFLGGGSSGSYFKKTAKARKDEK